MNKEKRTVPLNVSGQSLLSGNVFCGHCKGRITALNQEYANGQSKLKEIENNYTRILKWSEVFDGSPMEVKKMIASMIIHRVYVYENYCLEFEFNIDFEQFELGLDRSI